MSKNQPSDRREEMKAVTKGNPCPVCEGDHKCSVGDGGLILCGRRDCPVPGFRHLGASRGDPQFHLYRRDDGVPPNRAKPKAASPNRAGTDWEAVAKEHAGRMTLEVRRWLAGQLKLPVEVLDALPLLGSNGAAKDQNKYVSFPECDATGKVIGINRRFTDGTKKAMNGSGRGLTLVTGWKEKASPLFLVEGASDTLALTAAGLAAVGRPSNTGGVGYLAELLGEFPDDRTILVVGENDAKENGDWPGRVGAERTAAALQAELNRPVLVAMTPSGAKDVRQWLTERVGTGAAWEAAGRELVDLLTSAAETPPSSGRPEIIVTTEEHIVNDAATEALVGTEGIYQRGGQLVRVVCLNESTPSNSVVRVPAGATVIRDLCPPLLRDQFTRVADWFKWRQGSEGEMEKVPTHPPGWAVQAVHARGVWPGVPRLDAVVTHPILLADGSLLAASGYHRPSGVLVRLPDRMRLTVPDNPTRADANAALVLLTDAVRDFPFECPEHRGSWLAGLLTPLVWFAFTGPSPFFLIDGNVRGVGKGLLADTIALPVLGRRFSSMTYTHDRDELRKRITSVAAEGERMVLLDNLAGGIGNDQLDAALTSEWWKDRLLGGNRMYDGPLNVVWYGTGNNCELRADTSRRTCHIRMETTDERPEDRGGFKYPNLRDHLRRNRDPLLSAALTILRGWVVAGRPAGGFRASALASLTPADFNFAADGATVTLAARFNKSRKPKVQPLPTEVAVELKSYLKEKPKGERVWGGTWARDHRGAEMIRGDLEAAGIVYAVEGPDGPEYADFHALRHSFLTLGGRSGIDLRTLQELAGHSKPELTARYSHRRLYDLAGAVEKLPNILATDAPEQGQMKATGTDPVCTQFARTPCKSVQRGSSQVNKAGEEQGGAEMNEPLENQGFRQGETPSVIISHKRGRRDSNPQPPDRQSHDGTRHITGKQARCVFQHQRE